MMHKRPPIGSQISFIGGNEMQVKYFDDGRAGFVIHRIDGASAWFNSQGDILDAERRDTLGRYRQIKPNSPRWRALAHLGPIWRDKYN